MRHLRLVVHQLRPGRWFQRHSLTGSHFRYLLLHNLHCITNMASLIRPANTAWALLAREMGSACQCRGFGVYGAGYRALTVSSPFSIDANLVPLPSPPLTLCFLSFPPVPNPIPAYMVSTVGYKPYLGDRICRNDGILRHKLTDIQRWNRIGRS